MPCLFALILRLRSVESGVSQIDQSTALPITTTTMADMMDVVLPAQITVALTGLRSLTRSRSEVAMTDRLHVVPVAELPNEAHRLIETVVILLGPRETPGSTLMIVVCDHLLETSGPLADGAQAGATVQETLESQEILESLAMPEILAIVCRFRQWIQEVRPLQSIAVVECILGRPCHLQVHQVQALTMDQVETLHSTPIAQGICRQSHPWSAHGISHLIVLRHLVIEALSMRSVPHSLRREPDQRVSIQIGMAVGTEGRGLTLHVVTTEGLLHTHLEEILRVITETIVVRQNGSLLASLHKTGSDEKTLVTMSLSGLAARGMTSRNRPLEADPKCSSRPLVVSGHQGSLIMED